MMVNRIIEDFIRQHCSDFVAELVVVGSNRSSPVLPVEATSGQSAKETILERMAPFDRRFTWERLSLDTIVFVGKNTLPNQAMTSLLMPMRLS